MFAFIPDPFPQFAYMGVFRSFRISKSTNVAFFLSSSYPQWGDAFKKFEPTNQPKTPLSFFSVTRTGWQPLGQRARWNQSLVFQGMWTWSQTSGQATQTYSEQSSQSQVSLGGISEVSHAGISQLSLDRHYQNPQLRMASLWWWT